MAFGAIMAGVGLASSLVGGIMSIFGNQKKMVAAREQFIFEAEQDALVIEEMGERGLIENREDSRAARQIAGSQNVAMASQGKGFSASSLMALSDTATQLARTTESKNRALNWDIQQMQKGTMQKGKAMMNEIKALKAANAATGVGMAGQTAQAMPGIVGKKKTKPLTKINDRLDSFQNKLDSLKPTSFLAGFGPMGTPGFGVNTSIGT